MKHQLDVKGTPPTTGLLTMGPNVRQTDTDGRTDLCVVPLSAPVLLSRESRCVACLSVFWASSGDVEVIVMTVPSIKRGGRGERTTKARGDDEKTRTVLNDGYDRNAKRCYFFQLIMDKKYSLTIVLCTNERGLKRKM
jgi:hypothetical protein